MLRTPQDVINRVGIARLPQYSELVPMADSIGFSVQRPYPANTILGQALTVSGKPCVVCLVQFIVKPPPSGIGVSAVQVHALPFDRCGMKQALIPPPFRLTNHSDPEGPAPEWVDRLKHAPRPVDVQFTEQFCYDNAEDKFYQGAAEVPGENILEYVYDYHCRTLRWPFRTRWRLGSLWRAAIRESLWWVQELCMWVLLKGYDFVLDPEGPRWPLHEYKLQEFKRTTDESNSHFFGFETSARSLLSNLLVIAILSVGIYYMGPRAGLLRAVYGNTALTTAALLLGFLLADVLVPLGLKAAICTLSRLKPRLLFIARRVKA